MATTLGNNPTAGTAHVDVPTTDKPQSIVPPPATVTDLTDFAKLDKAVTGAFKGAENAFDRVATAIINAHDAKVWEHVTHSVTNKAFKSEAAYFADRASTFPILNKSLSKALMVTLHERGLSLRAIAAVTNVKSQVTVANTVNEAKGEATSEGTNESSVTEAEAKAAKLAKGLPGLLTRVVDSLADMSTEDLAATLAALTDATNTARGEAKARAELIASSRNSVKAKADAKGVKVTPATAARKPAPAAPLKGAPVDPTAVLASA